MDDFPAEVRGQFPGLSNKVFLDAACVSLAPRCAASAIERFLEQALYCPAPSATLHHIAMDEAKEQARTQGARLLRAEVNEIALVQSTTEGLSIIARSIPWSEGDTVLTSDLEFIEVPLAFRQLSSRGVTVRMVANQEGRLPVSAFESAIDSSTRALVVSSVQWSNGYRLDLQELGELCRRKEIFLVVDAIQHLGAMPLDVSKTPVDVVIAGGHKWLNAPFGVGLLYISSQARDRLRPPLAGYLAAQPPPGGWGAYFQDRGVTPLEPVRFCDETRRFEAGGTSNYPGAVGLAASLKLINDLGPEAIEAQVRRLTDHFIERLGDLPVQLITPAEPRHRSGIVSFEVAASSQESVRLMEYLLERRILVAVRYTSGVGGIRVSCHFFNTLEEIDSLADAVGEYLARPTPQPQSASPRCR